MEKRKYEIRHLPRYSGYYCILWIDCGQNIFVTIGTWEHKQVMLFENGTGYYKSIKDLHFSVLENHVKKGRYPHVNLEDYK